MEILIVGLVLLGAALVISAHVRKTVRKARALARGSAQCDGCSCADGCLAMEGKDIRP